MSFRVKSKRILTEPLFKPVRLLRIGRVVVVVVVVVLVLVLLVGLPVFLMPQKQFILLQDGATVSSTVAIHSVITAAAMFGAQGQQ